MICKPLSFIFLPVFLEENESDNFPFPELSIKKLANGGYEIEVGIEGKLTQERKEAMLKEIKRITGEEYSGMEFTVDPLKPSCEHLDKKGQSKLTTDCNASLKK